MSTNMNEQNVVCEHTGTLFGQNEVLTHAKYGRTSQNSQQCKTPFM
jgi:hypothetical protein